ncbi:hypothetical protein IAR55_004006 [Kwoniella newhampshirensis]|uniref:GDP/GTP exchange factor Sec2 N-terminal domain-containing protein n=1 Tax=Kwoniella newhampshirensis TaxID=1651941 RepID=A0AAW0YL88_9TREE
MAGRESFPAGYGASSGSDVRSPVPRRPSTPASQRSVPPRVGNLPYLQPGTNGSASSLMEAVIGPASLPHSSSPSTSHHFQPSHLGDSRRDPSTSSTTLTKNSDRIESDWDVLSDASGKLNEGEAKKQDEQVVQELQEKVDKRKSVLPHLESELAALEAQIKAAEEKLARAQGSGVVAGTSGASQSA